MASSQDTRHVVGLASAKLAAAVNGTLAVATLEADADLLALVDDAEMLSSLLATRVGKEWLQLGTNYVRNADCQFDGTSQYDLILIASGQVPLAGTTCVLTWADAVLDTASLVGFTVAVNAAPVVIASAVTTGTTTTLTLAVPITAGQVVTASYDASGVVTDTAGRAVRPFTNLAVTNNVV